MCELVDVIGNTGIKYCTIPSSDHGKKCEKCTVYKKDIFVAIAEEILNLRKEIKNLKKRIYHQDINQERNKELQVHGITY